MKIKLLMLLILLHQCIFSQNQSMSVLTHQNYLELPNVYLHHIDSTQVPFRVLMDRASIDSIVYQINGVDEVRTIEVSDWAKIYRAIQSAAYDTTTFSEELSSIEERANRLEEKQNAYAFGLLHIDFSTIKANSIEDGTFVQGDYLIDHGLSPASYEQNQLFSFSILDHQLYGDQITYYIDESFIFSNKSHLSIQSIEIDFGDGTGYQNVALGDYVEVDYGSDGAYLMLKLRMHYWNTQTQKVETYYAHHSNYRKGTNNVPLPDIFRSSTNVNAVVPNPDRIIYYPVGEYDTLIKATVLYSPYNSFDDRFRKPIIITDGFDPWNLRDYYKTSIGIDGELPRAEDKRGLYELINGEPSPWYDTEPSPNLIQSLHNAGYDIIIIDFYKGAGDIFENAGLRGVRGFLNDVINSSDYRDEHTQEIVLIGPSMGGIITRIALTEMEKAGEDHFVKYWISFDSPQEGAYIPLSMQHSLAHLSDLKPRGANALKAAKEAFQNGRDKLNTPAARQLLLYHHESTGDQGQADPLFYDLYSTLDNLGYPLHTWNFSITNGGKSKLYAQDGTQNLDFKLLKHLWSKGYAHQNIDGKYLMMRGSRYGSKNDVNFETASQVAHDNAPGGWHAGLYSLNAHKEQKNVKEETNTPYMKACFISTASAFGIEPTRSMIHKDWTNFTTRDDFSSEKIRTPFDVIRGQQENEEHVRISQNTATYLMGDVLSNEYQEAYRPQRRVGEQYAKQVDGAVAYALGFHITFAGAQNTYQAKESSVINIRSKERISFMPGFSAKAGATVSAKIDEEYFIGSRSASDEEGDQSHLEFYKGSPYAGQITDYTNLQEEEISEEQLVFDIYPNPSNGDFTIQFDNHIDFNTEIKITDAMGRTIQILAYPKGNKIEVKDFQGEQGIYYISIQAQDKVYSKKLLLF